jgi:hypothetical protein
LRAPEANSRPLCDATEKSTTGETQATNTGSESNNTPKSYCQNEYQDPIDVIVDQYYASYKDLLASTETLGSTETFDREWEAVMGDNTAFALLDCHGDGCIGDFYDAIEDFKIARKQAKNAKQNFEYLFSMVDSEDEQSCDVEHREYIRSQAKTGKVQSSLLVDACDDFIKSAKNQIDNSNSQFRRDQHFRDGMEAYGKVGSYGIPQPERFKEKLTVYMDDG